MKIMVTGSAGFVGRHLMQSLRKTKHRLIGVNLRATRYSYDLDFENGPEEVDCYCNLEDEGPVATLLLRAKPDMIIHLAANPSVRENAMNPTAITRTNIQATHNLLAYCKPGTRFVLASTVEVYGNRSGIVDECTSPEPCSVYGATKVAAEALVQAYAAKKAISPLILRYCNILGQDKGYGIVHDLVAKLRTGEKTLPLRGRAPGTKKHFLHIDMVVEETILLAFGTTQGIRNVTSVDRITTEHVAKILMEELGIHKPITWTNEEDGSTRNLQVLSNASSYGYASTAVKCAVPT